MSNKAITNKIRLLGLIIVLVIASIITFQVSWVSQTYERSKEAIRGNLKNDLEMIVSLHEQEIADSIRKLLKEIIQVSPSFNYVVVDKADGVAIGYQYDNYGYVRIKINSLKPNYTQNEAHQLLLDKLNDASLSELRAIYHSLIAPRHFADPILEDLAKQLMDLFIDPFANTSLLNKIVKRTFDNQEPKFYGNARFITDIDQINGQGESDISEENTTNEREIIVEIIPEQLSLDKKLSLIEAKVKKLNAKGDSVYVVKPLLDNVAMPDQIPLILLAVKLPPAYALKTMLYLALALALQMLFLGACIISLFYLILKQKKLSEIKDDFIGNVSHELKTPVATTLAAIQGMQHFDILKDKSKTDQYLNTAAREMQRLSAMIDTILNSSVYERSDFELHVATLNLKEMLVEIINILQLHTKREVHIELNYQAREKILADRTHFHNVLINLIDNAIKYGNEVVAIKIECIDYNQGIKIRIEDNGNGIPIAYQKHIFDKFFRVPTPHDHRVKGYGLGLNYVKNIIEKHKGKISLSKSDNKGSTFEIILPQ